MSLVTEFAPLSTILAAVSALLAAALSTFAKSRIKLVTAVNEKERHRDYHAEVRLREVKALLSQEGEKKFMFRIASASLVFGQFVVGGGSKGTCLNS